MTEIDCPECGGPTHYEKDAADACQVYECNVCGKSFHVETTD